MVGWQCKCNDSDRRCNSNAMAALAMDDAMAMEGMRATEIDGNGWHNKNNNRWWDGNTTAIMIDGGMATQMAMEGTRATVIRQWKARRQRDGGNDNGQGDIISDRWWDSDAPAMTMDGGTTMQW